MNEPGSKPPSLRSNPHSGMPPANVRLGPNTLISGELSFKRFLSNEPDALVIGANCTMDGVHFALAARPRRAVFKIFPVDVFYNKDKTSVRGDE